MAIAVPASAQTHRNDYVNLLFTAGYQQLSHPSGTYNVVTIHGESVYSFVGSRYGVTFGPDYFSFSLCGVIMAAPNIFKKAINSLDEEPLLKMIEMMTLVSAMQFHIPLSNRCEMTMGWDAVKFTKLKNYSRGFYVTGSLNAGMSVYLGDIVFLNMYYEYNHTHNPFIDMLNWVDFGISHQPSVLKGHSFGVRIGLQF